MKITVCGKGGCGKSTVTTLLAKELARMEKKVLVVDSDESNSVCTVSWVSSCPEILPNILAARIKPSKP